MCRIPSPVRLLWMAIAVIWFVAVEDAYASENESRLTLVSNAKSHTVVVINREAGTEVRYAAAELVNYIERISGARLKVREDGGPNSEPGHTPIRIGVDESVLERVGEDGFVIRIDTRCVELCGATGVAAVYATYTFLEEHLGCRWFFPIKLGEDIPENKTIVVSPFQKEYRPSFRFRHIGRTSEFGWNLKNRCSEDLRIGDREYSKVWGVAHTFHKLLPPEEYFEDHPEWFALVDGERKPHEEGGLRTQICTSNEEAICEVARRVNVLFDEDPRLAMVTPGPNDVIRWFCQCEECQGQDEPGHRWRGPGSMKKGAWRGILSRRMLLFYNRVARLVKKQHPDKLIKAMFYSWYQQTPSDPDLRLEDNILVMLTHSGIPNAVEKVFPSCYNHSLTDPTCRPNQERFLAALKGWRQRSKQMGIFEYYWKVVVCQVLFPIVHTIREDLPYYHSQGVEYFYAMGQAYNSGVIGLNYYVTAKLLWDVDTDVDALLSDFYKRYYRESAKPMQHYHDLLEESMAARGGDVLGYLFFTTKVFDAGTTRRLRRLLSEAEQLASSDRVRKRVELARTALAYTLLAKDLWAELEKGYAELVAKHGDPIRDKAMIVAALDKRVEPYRKAVFRYAQSQESLAWIAHHYNTLRLPSIATKCYGALRVHGPHRSER